MSDQLPISYSETTPSAPFADIVVCTDAPGLPQPFTYAIPEAMAVAIGDGVLIPFGAQQVTGYIVTLKQTCPPDLIGKIKPIASVIENSAAFDAALYQVATWTAAQTLCELREAVRLIAPDVMASQIQTVVSLMPDWRQRLVSTRAADQIQIATALDGLEGTASPAKLARAAGLTGIGPALAALRRKGVVEEKRSLVLPKTRRKVIRLLSLCVESEIASEEALRMQLRAPQQARVLNALIDAEADAGSGQVPSSGLAIGSSDQATARALCEKGLAKYTEFEVHRNPFRMLSSVKDEPPPWTDEQRAAISGITQQLQTKKSATILLHGITGSGKTEVYLAAVRTALDMGRTALIMLPEIGLTAQLLDLFKMRFGDEIVGVLHSALSLGERHDEWQRIRRGQARVVIGARSAIFAPIEDLGLIVMDEEHDGSYKQDSSPRYHARDVAQYRARHTGATVVLGSATPSLESFYKAKTGEYALISLTHRIDHRPLPIVKVVDFREELRIRREHDPEDDSPINPPGIGPLGGQLMEAMRSRLEKREQIILFLNRRGFATFLLCRDCGFTFRCTQCDVSLAYHHGERALRCHHCDWRRAAPDICPQCHGLRLKPFGLGTERVEDAVTTAFPEARALRMDRDTMAVKGAHAATLRAFRRGDADILIGTQMVAKGLDFPRVTLVGVVSADVALNVPDFRSAERAFQLLTQVAGRSGRGKVPGEVIVQTFTPEHESVQHAAKHDYMSFYAGEILHRREVDYPPFACLVNFVFADPDEAAADTRSRRFEQIMRQSIRELRIEAGVLGPVACPLARLKGKYRWHLVLRCHTRPDALALARRTLAKSTPADRMGVSLDIDPLTML